MNPWGRLTQVDRDATGPPKTSGSPAHVGRRSWWATAVVVLAASLAPGLSAQSTQAERTEARETSRYHEVIAFLDSLTDGHRTLRRGLLARSTEGRPVPWVLAARPMVDDPAAAHRSGKPIVYLQANIHAGEVEGKEAALMLLRDLTAGALGRLLDSVILLVVPIYNPDGNERLGPLEQNRPGQAGPALVGQRANGQGLDLNRDYVKMEAPETRGAADLINTWDPDLFVDLHTTNGSYHGYALTYAPGLNPNSGAPNAYVRDRFLPALRERMRMRHGHETFPYGNFRNQDPDSLVQGWYTYDPRPRFGTNWFALRGRMAILSEAYSNAPFQARIRATYDFVLEILRLVAEEQATIKHLTTAAAQERPDSIALTATYADPVWRDVIAEVTLDAGDGSHGFSRRQRTGEFRTIAIPVYDRFAPRTMEVMPAGYLVPPPLDPVVALLRRHGIRVERLSRRWQGPVEGFRVDRADTAERAFEGHRLVTVRGRWSARQDTIPAGWSFIPTDQRLGVLAAYLLEPASADGMATWGLLGADLRPGVDGPILRVRRPPETPSVELP